MIHLDDLYSPSLLISLMKNIILLKHLCHSLPFPWYFLSTSLTAIAHTQNQSPCESAQCQCHSSPSTSFLYHSLWHAKWSSSSHTLFPNRETKGMTGFSVFLILISFSIFHVHLLWTPWSCPAVWEPDLRCIKNSQQWKIMERSNRDTTVDVQV